MYGGALTPPYKAPLRIVGRGYSPAREGLEIELDAELEEASRENRLRRQPLGVEPAGFSEDGVPVQHVIEVEDRLQPRVATETEELREGARTLIVAVVADERGRPNEGAISVVVYTTSAERAGPGRLWNVAAIWIS